MEVELLVAFLDDLNEDIEELQKEITQCGEDAAMVQRLQDLLSIRFAVLDELRESQKG